MTAPQLDLEWHQEPQRLTGGVVDGFIAYCGCGWRAAATYFTKKADNRERAEYLYALHREKFCPFASLPPVQVYGSQLLASSAVGDEGQEG